MMITSSLNDCNEKRSVANSRAEPQQAPSVEKHAHPPREVFALYTQHLLDSQSLEFEICIFPRKATPSHYFPLREDSSRVLAWVRQLLSGSCHYPTAATKSRATASPVGGKACSSTKGGLLRYIPNTLLPPPRRLVPSLGLGTSWVRQLLSGSCHYPTAATKSRAEP